MIKKQHKIPDTAIVFLIAAFFVTLSLSLQANIGLGMSDEGYLWYGAIQTTEGEIPMRDFQSYDPGRYYWCAFWMLFLGNGLISLRISVALFQVLGLWLGLLTIWKESRSWRLVTLSGFILLLWMMPRHKLFESSLSMAGVYFAYCLIKNPSARQHFISGLFVGIAAFFGCNHGLYNFTAFFILTILIWFKIDRSGLIKKMGLFTAGITAGYSPMLIMAVFVPGFFEAIINFFATWVQRGSTNLTNPVPWPWKINFSSLNFWACVEHLSFRIFFVLLPLFYCVSFLLLLFSKKEHIKRRAIIIAATIVGLTYMHHAFARANIAQLGQAVHPLLIFILALPLTVQFKGKKTLCVSMWIILLAITFFSVGRKSEYYWKLTAKDLVSYNINGDNIWIPEKGSIFIDFIKDTEKKFTTKDEGFVVGPYLPAMYPILQRRSPLYDIYFLLKPSKEKQDKMIENLNKNNVTCVLMGNVCVDGRKNLLFRKLYKHVWKYLKNNYQLTNGYWPDYTLFTRKNIHNQNTNDSLPAFQRN